MLYDGEDNLGGFLICRPKPLTYQAGTTHGFTLISDLHIGAAHTDYALIKEELETARKHGDRVLINGDVFDAIIASDRKRFQLDCLHPRLHGNPDILGGSLEMAVELLGPYAENIDLIGSGNHETCITKYHSLDLMSLLIRELQKMLPPDSEHRIHYGGYGGYLDYRFKRMSSTSLKKPDVKDHGRRYVIHYFHGAGGAAPVTKGMIDFHRRQWVEADLIWLGHKHNRFNSTVEVLSCPLQGHNPNVREVRHVMSGAYFKTYSGQTQKNIRKHGRRSNYGADSGYAPQGKGGARVTITFSGTGKMTVRVIQ